MFTIKIGYYNICSLFEFFLIEIKQVLTQKLLATKLLLKRESPSINLIRKYNEKYRESISSPEFNKERVSHLVKKMSANLFKMTFNHFLPDGLGSL